MLERLCLPPIWAGLYNQLIISVKNKKLPAVSILLLKIIIMEKRVLGIILAVVGILGLILAAVDFVNGGHGSKGVKAVVAFAILGAIFFSAGISLVRSTNDKVSVR